MSSEPDLSALEYEVSDNVVVWHVTDFETLYEEEMEDGHQLYLDVAGKDEITAIVVRFDGTPSLGPEKQEYINEVWSEFAQAVDIGRAAYVGEGISALAVKSNVEAPGVEVDSFSDVDEAVEWAQKSG
jgi:hypothetical protein